MAKGIANILRKIRLDNTVELVDMDFLGLP